MVDIDESVGCKCSIRKKEQFYLWGLLLQENGIFYYIQWCDEHLHWAGQKNLLFVNNENHIYYKSNLKASSKLHLIENKRNQHSSIKHALHNKMASVEERYYKHHQFTHLGGNEKVGRHTEWDWLMIYTMLLLKLRKLVVITVITSILCYEIW